nr:immunoglobulin heavy chain junction region [Macaca mulatta]MOW19778.1 immunoglobulin heavy chain junction region [Macaca mulatta]MOW19926.1 immunoglobulin heavy chain junction region [Macaca mulatta]MOW19985.1 immunoglobulin heavy chain junction region [Macaca mulatta]MOW20472.1 immunoglobulin heavy chain junction region [Macaca mulatta]
CTLFIIPMGGSLDVW